MSENIQEDIQNYLSTVPVKENIHIGDTLIIADRLGDNVYHCKVSGFNHDGNPEVIITNSRRTSTRYNLLHIEKNLK